MDCTNVINVGQYGFTIYYPLIECKLDEEQPLDLSDATDIKVIVSVSKGEEAEYPGVIHGDPKDGVVKLFITEEMTQTAARWIQRVIVEFPGSRWVSRWNNDLFVND